MIQKFFKNQSSAAARRTNGDFLSLQVRHFGNAAGCQGVKLDDAVLQRADAHDVIGLLKGGHPVDRPYAGIVVGNPQLRLAGPDFDSIACRSLGNYVIDCDSVYILIDYLRQARTYNIVGSAQAGRHQGVHLVSSR